LKEQRLAFGWQSFDIHPKKGFIANDSEYLIRYTAG